MKHRSQKKRNKKIIVNYYFDKITHRLRKSFSIIMGNKRERERNRFPKLITRRNNFNKVSVFFYQALILLQAEITSASLVSISDILALISLISSH